MKHLTRVEALDLFGVDLGFPRNPASLKWFGIGFALGAHGAKETQRKGRPRLKAMVVHWKAGIRAGRLARSICTHLYMSELHETKA